ncbi:hypothetical protein L596_010119 [Steinernema carpocapsae]|uniref:Uncharacterized protein n=1 Tax=Steinernema carpocapsae TaxID=34508 RepID=A0A4U5PI55_STECR|nr:hypothetical protein L596_010119 [Steinernema carpocapsae]
MAFAAEFPKHFFHYRYILSEAGCVTGMLLNVLIVVGICLVKKDVRKNYQLNVMLSTIVDIFYASMYALTLPGFSFENNLSVVITGPIALLNSLNSASTPSYFTQFPTTLISTSSPYPSSNAILSSASPESPNT